MFIEECNRQLPDGAADSTRCTELCAHCTCLSTMPVRITVLKWSKRNNGHIVTFQT